MRRLALIAAVALTAQSALAPGRAMAQSDDRGYLVGLLEDNLSGAGRKVTIDGFAGALSSRATIQQMTIADSDGVWLTLRDVELDWNRAALLRGAVSVNALTAGEIEVARAPVAEPSDLPAPEATAFSLPDLPVSVQIGRIASDKIILGAPLLGEPVTAEMSGALTLAGGEGNARLEIDRIDTGPRTRVDLSASFANASRRLVVDLSVVEQANGLIGGLIGLPGRPDFSLTVKGDGIVDAYAARLKLDTAGEERLAGTLVLRRGTDQAMAVTADLSGNVAPLFLPDYAEFFGDRISLAAEARIEPDGAIELSRMELDTRALTLTGTLALAPDRLPERINLDGRIAHADGGAVLLPLPGDQRTSLDSAELRIGFDRAAGPDWTGRLVIAGLDRPDVTARELRIDARGRIDREAGTGRVVQGLLSFAGSGLALTDPALAQAVGDQISGGVDLLWAEQAGHLEIRGLSMGGTHYALAGSGTVDGLDAALRVAGSATLTASELARFAALAGRPLSGSGKLVLSGSGSPLEGSFDIEAEVTGQDVAVGQAQADRLLAGASRIAVSALRDGTGTTIRSFTASAPKVTASAQGKLATAGSDLTARLALPDLSVLGTGFRGAVTGDLRVTGTTEQGDITGEVSARNLAVGQPQADRLLAGDSTISLDLGLRDGRIEVRNARLANPQLRIGATGTLTGDVQTVTLDGRLANLGILLPEFPGPVTLAGTARIDGTGTTLDLTGSGPGQIQATARGRIDPGFARADIALRGTAQAALAGSFISPRAISGPVRFDLRLNGPVSPASLSGTVALSDGRFSDPGLGLALERIETTATLASGRARIDGAARVDAGGRVSAQGTVGLTAPFDGDVTVRLDRAVFIDPELYRTVANGRITVKGPLTGGGTIGGRIALVETEVRVPSTGFASSDIPPDMIHIGASAAVLATLARAGLIPDPTAERPPPARPFVLDLDISAPNQVFVRGRGLDAELGGDLLLRGTTAAIVPSGGFDLIRGRLDILGKRLELSRASLRLEGDFDPFLDVAAVNQGSSVVSMVVIEGPASDPQVRFESVPALPEEEVLAQLLFGRDLGSLTPLQAARLASAVATLAGRGGIGLMGRLRDNLGLDDLDVTTNESGNTALTAGRYLSDNAYTEISVDDGGQSEIHLNVDLTDTIQLQARASSDGTTGLGLFLERDY